MHIVVASDNNYVPHMATLIYSICHYNSKEETINIHVLNNGINNESIANLSSLEDEFNNLKISYYSFTSDDIEKKIGCKLAHDRSISSYARLFIPEILDKSIERAIYLDVDAIVCHPLHELVNLDLKGNCIAGVLDVVRIDKKQSVGLEENDAYINAGMIVWDLKQCRNTNVIQKFIDFINNKNGDVVAMDQGTINGTLTKSIYLLHPKWNVLTPFFQMNLNELLLEYGMNIYYSELELEEAVMNPGFIHFVPNYTSRPWSKGCKHPLKHQYWKFREKTLFNSTLLQKDTRTYKQKILGFAFYALPFNLFFLMKKAIVKRK